MSAPDPVTLAVVAGTLDSTIREMTITMRRAAMSPVLTIGNDFSNGIFDGQARMVLQGQDQPVHLGAMIFAAKQVVRYFAGALEPGDVIYHNDPATGGSHLQDMTLYKPIFFKGELVFWGVNRSHMNETGGPVAGGYNPLAEEIWAEGLRISPVKLYAGGKPRQDVLDFLMTNFRTRRQFGGDLAAQLATANMAEQRLVQLLEHYGINTVKDCLEALMDRAEDMMRRDIRSMPEGEYHGKSVIEDDGHGSGELEIRATVKIQAEQLQIALEAPPQTRSYNNSYAANSMGGVYLGVITYVDPNIPHNEGMYRPLTVDLGPKGTVINATEPAACGMSTSTPYGHIAEAIRNALAPVLPERAGGGWAKVCIDCLTGIDPRNGDPYTYLSHMTGWGGGGAFWGQDGEAAVGPIEVAGAAMTGDIEVVEHMLPLQIQRYELDPHSAGAGRWRGGWGTLLEIAPVGHTSQIAFLGDGMKFPPPGVMGAGIASDAERVYRKYIVGSEHAKRVQTGSVHSIRPGEVLQIHVPGGGGVGLPYDRDPERVVADVRNGLITVDNARADYGVAIEPEQLTLDEAETRLLRRRL